jgi:hypothetical protein
MSRREVPVLLRSPARWAEAVQPENLGGLPKQCAQVRIMPEVRRKLVAKLATVAGHRTITNGLAWVYDRECGAWLESHSDEMLRFYRTHYARTRLRAVNWLSTRASWCGLRRWLPPVGDPRPPRLRRKHGAMQPARPPHRAAAELAHSDAVPT